MMIDGLDPQVFAQMAQQQSQRTTMINNILMNIAISIYCRHLDSTPLVDRANETEEEFHERAGEALRTRAMIARAAAIYLGEALGLCTFIAKSAPGAHDNDMAGRDTT